MFKPIRSISRLILGGMVLGYDGLKDRIKNWEKQASGIEDSSKSEEITISNIEPAGSVQEPPSLLEKQKLDSLGYLIVGLTFKVQEHLEDGMRAVSGISQLIGTVTRPITKPLSKNRFVMPMRNSFENLVSRGQQEVEHWIDIGQREAATSRTMAETAIRESMDSSIEYLASNPQVEELVQTQSVSLVDEIVEEMRERMISADDLMEGFIRHVLRLPSRSELPPPPLEIRRHAIPFRLVKGRRTNK